MDPVLARFDTIPPLTAAESYDPMADKLPTPAPAVTATLELCPCDLRSPTMHVIAESDCHPVPSLAVPPHRAPADGMLTPVPTLEIIILALYMIFWVENRLESNFGLS